MTLQEYLSDHKLTATEFAGQIGVSQVAVTRYILGHRVPRPIILSRIAEQTGGKVTANDFLPPPPAPSEEGART